MTVSGKIEVYNISHTGYCVKVTGASIDGGLKGVSFPTWSRKEKYSEDFGKVADQDDIISDHSFDRGEYFTHVYLYRQNGTLEGLGGETITIPDPPKTMKKRGGYAVYWWPTVHDRRGDKLLRNTIARKTIHNPYSSKGGKIIAGEITQALNTINEFTFAIPFTHPLYNKMVPFKSIIEVVNLYDGTIEFVGRVLTTTNEMTTDGFAQKVTCEDFLSFQKLPNRGAGQYLLEMLNVANGQVEDYKRYSLRKVTVNSGTDKPFRYIGYESTWDCVRERIINNIGGYLRVYELNTVLHLDWTKDIGVTKKSPIQIGKNIKSASRLLDFDGLATQIQTKTKAQMLQGSKSQFGMSTIIACSLRIRN